MLWVNQGFLWPFSSSQTGSLPEGIHDFPWTHHVHPFVLRPWEVWSIPSGEINKFVTKLATHMAHTRISLANFNMSPTWNDSGKKRSAKFFRVDLLNFRIISNFHIFSRGNMISSHWNRRSEGRPDSMPDSSSCARNCSWKRKRISSKAEEVGMGQNLWYQYDNHIMHSDQLLVPEYIFTHEYKNSPF